MTTNIQPLSPQMRCSNGASRPLINFGMLHVRLPNVIIMICSFASSGKPLENFDPADTPSAYLSYITVCNVGRIAIFLVHSAGQRTSFLKYTHINARFQVSTHRLWRTAGGHNLFPSNVWLPGSGTRSQRSCVLPTHTLPRPVGSFTPTELYLYGDVAAVPPCPWDSYSPPAFLSTPWFNYIPRPPENGPHLHNWHSRCKHTCGNPLSSSVCCASAYRSQFSPSCSSWQRDPHQNSRHIWVNDYNVSHDRDNQLWSFFLLHKSWERTAAHGLY